MLACPPVYLIPRAWKHAQHCGAMGTLVVPLWKSAKFGSLSASLADIRALTFWVCCFFCDLMS